MGICFCKLDLSWFVKSGLSSVCSLIYNRVWRIFMLEMPSSRALQHPPRSSGHLRSFHHAATRAATAGTRSR